MWVYEKNYALLRRLFPDLDSCDCFEFTPPTPGLRFRMQVLERCRYTCMLELRQKLALPDRYLRDLVMKIRLYEDARLAEVTGYEGIGRLLPRYDYPNRKMLLRDEKRQANLLLHEWLNLVLAHDMRQQGEYA